jgi:hypothetical protein
MVLLRAALAYLVLVRSHFSSTKVRKLDSEGIQVQDVAV